MVFPGFTFLIVYFSFFINPFQMTTPILHTTDLSLGVQPDGWLLEKVNLSIEAGQKTVLMGTSGSGKSVLFHALFGFFPSRHEGGIEIFGKRLEPGSEGEIRRRMGLVFQNPEDQFICATVEEELRFGPENLSLSPDEIEHGIAGLSESLGLETLLERSPLSLSWGEKKKVALASMLTCEPDLLLVDDPFSGLGEEDQKRVAGTLEAFSGTLLLSCPIVPPPCNFGTHWGVLEKGKPITLHTKEALLKSAGDNS